MRPSTLALGLIVSALAACGGGLLGTSGAAGTIGTGEGATGGPSTAGWGGTGATGGSIGGTGGELPGCAPGLGRSDFVSFAVTTGAGTAIESPVSAAVTVAGVESCNDCPTVLGPSLAVSAGASRIRLRAVTSALEWTLYFYNSAMPADFIKVGDAFDMRIDAKVETSLYTTTDQTLVLMRDGKVILFAATMHRFGSPPLPDLLPFGIAVSDAGPTCESPSTGCGQRGHALRVSIATDADVVIAGAKTGAIGGLVITNAAMIELVDSGFCDAKSSTLIAGFRPAGTGAGGTTGGSGGGGSDGGGTSGGGTGG